MLKKIAITTVILGSIILGAISGFAMVKDELQVFPASEQTELDDDQKEDPIGEGVRIEKAEIEHIDSEIMRVLIKPLASESHESIALNVSDETKIMVDGTATELNELEEGQTVTVLHSLQMTRSLPPQTAAFEIEVIE